MFRACVVELLLYNGNSPRYVLFTSPSYFGIAHAHHAIESSTHGENWVRVLIATIFQGSFTTVFGWFATFLYMRCGSIWPGILVHSFCNFMGPPKVYGMIDGSRLKTALYYSCLLLGPLLFYMLAFPLTDSKNAIARF